MEQFLKNSKYVKVESDEELYKPLKDRKKVFKITAHNIKA